MTDRELAHAIAKSLKILLFDKIGATVDEMTEVIERQIIESKKQKR